MEAQRRQAKGPEHISTVVGRVLTGLGIGKEAGAEAPASGREETPRKGMRPARSAFRSVTGARTPERTPRARSVRHHCLSGAA